MALCRDALTDVGDADLGEWWERGSKPGLVHLRRRLSAAEQALTGDVRDIRGMPEERIRMAVLLRDAPHLKSYVKHSTEAASRG